MTKMKHKILFFLGLLLIIPTAAMSQDITLINDTEDVITIDINVYDVKEKESINAAIPYAYYTIFFRGFPDSYYFKDGLVGTDENFVNRHSEYFKKMEEGRFSSFITAASLINYNKKSKPKAATVRMSINMRALKRDLEQQGIKRRFGL
ncbi:MAG: hypothetical protein J1E38_03985 [Paramuribaculum sp.]|nr:hypothetical protein [Paramuribaculum sp.]